MRLIDTRPAKVTADDFEPQRVNPTRAPSPAEFSPPHTATA
ncbi:hypothetical protein I545_2667 [Mycobacterium kansasii 662]|uniref:Uncharacterized protein n=1 Tax=Mycobacterium kansasii 662 TaxID=1299326 RepID=X7ZGS2_MYCKA|nr:hypothetical protein I545_2667 [Mycobacterium kansasii 662]